MASRLAVLLRHDAVLQWRYRIFGAYAVVVFITAVLVFWLRDVVPGWFIGLVIFTDNAPVGFFFLGGLLMLERAENVRGSLAVTPVSAFEYLLSKAMTFSGITLVAVVLLGFASGKPVNWPLYLAASAITSFFYLGLGAFVAARTKTVTGYITSAVIWFLPVLLPAGVAILEPMPLIFAALPTAAQFDLIIAGLEGTPLSTFRLFVLAGTSTISAALAFHFGVKSLQADFGDKS